MLDFLKFSIGVTVAVSLCACSNGLQGSNPLPVSGASKNVGHPGSARGASMQITEFPLPHSNSGPQGITFGPDGNLWFVEAAGNRIGRITPAGKIKEFTLPHSGSQPENIAVGSDGNLWFTEFYGNAIGRITRAGKITEFSSGLSPGSGPNGITAAQGSLWFTESSESPNGIKIGMITTKGKITKQFSIPTAYNSNPEGIALGWDGNLWFAEANAGNAIGQSTPTGSMNVYSSGLSFGAYPQDIAMGPDGNLWFTESGSTARIGRITITGGITEFTSGISQCGCNYNLYGIAAGPDGNVWFTESATNLIANITTGGQVTEFSGLSANSSPTGITAGPQGTLWFAENAGNRIGRLMLPPK